jgi:restriction endonuclease Mrr
MTPEDYIAAVKARPYVTWISTYYHSSERVKQLLEHGYLLNRWPGKLYYACSHAWIVTSSTFSVSAVALAAKDPTISLVDGQALSKLCEQFRTSQIPAFSWDEWEKIKHVAERFA